MASRPPDFKASGVRVERIIASGSDINPKLYIIGKDAAGNDGITVDTDNLVLSGDGTDTWLFISGGIGNSNRVTFGGDVYISGTLTAAAGGGTSPGGANTEVQFNNTGAFSGSSGLRYIASTQTLVVANLTVTGTSTIVTSSNLVISDPLIYLASGSTSSNQNGGIALASGSSVTNQALVFGRVANDVWGVGRQDVVGGTSTSLTGMTHVPMRASAIQLGGSVAVLTSSDGTTATLSGSSVQLKANVTDGVKFYETGSEYLQFSMYGGSSALIRATEVAYPSLYLSGQQVHLDASSGQIWFGKYATERLLVDTTDANNPALVAKLPSGLSFPIIISGSGVVIGSNDGTATFKRGTTNYLKATYDGINDVTVSAQSFNVNFGSQGGIAALSGSGVSLNSTSGVTLQRDGVTYATIANNGINTSISASNSVYIKPGASGSLFVSGSVITPKLTGSLTTLLDGTPYLLAGPNITITTSSNGSIQITGSAGGGGSSNWNELSPSPRLNTTASVALAGGLGSSYAAQSAGSNVHFFVSGSIGATPTIASSGTSLFNGDVATSGSIYLVTGSYESVISLVGTSTAADLEIRNRTSGGSVIHSVRTSTGNTVNFLDVRPNGSQENTKVSIMRSSYAGSSTSIDPYKSTDTNFFVGGVSGSKDGSTGGTSVFGGDLVISGSTYIGTSNVNNLVVNGRIASDIIPSSDRVYNLGSATQRFANVYTGDLHLRNERGDYTLIEEEDCLTIRFNKTGKRYKFVLEPTPQYDEDPVVR